MLILNHLSISIQDTTIVDDISYEFVPGVTAILGHNGSGKSSLALAIAGHPRYTTIGTVSLDGQDILALDPTLRSHLGIFLSLQNIPEIPGIKVLEYLRTIYSEYFARTHPGEKVPSPFVFKRMVEKLLPELHLHADFLERDLFVGFSGGEKRRLELLQIALLDPSVIILDEIDSGLDIDALEVLRNRVIMWRSMSKIIIIITHNFHLIDTIEPDRIVIIKD
jgi:Fe-S cluster assembly ATP-binding protein